MAQQPEIMEDVEGLEETDTLKLTAPSGILPISSQDDLSIQTEKKRNTFQPLTPNPAAMSAAKKATKTKRKGVNDSQRIAELEAQIKSLTRDNKVLQRKLEKIETSTGKKQKKMDSEREMRLAANKERYSLKQKLDKLQKAISVRIKLLGVDFSKINDITTALDTCFNVIQKLAKQLQQKEDELAETKQRLSVVEQDVAALPDMQLQINELVQENADVAASHDTLHVRMEQLQQTIEELTQQNDGYMKELDRLQDERKEWDKDKEKLETRLNNEEQTTKELRHQVEHLHQQEIGLKDALLKEYEEKIQLKTQEYDKLQQEYSKEIEDRAAATKRQMIKFDTTVASLHEQIEEKDKVIHSQKRKMKKMQQEMDMAGIGANKNSSEMSLLKKNVDRMREIIRDRENQIKTLTNKLKQAEKNNE